MPTLARCLAVLSCITFGHSVANAASPLVVTRALFTKSLPDSCTLPAPAWNFGPNDEAVNFWFNVKNVPAGAKFRLRWYHGVDVAQEDFSPSLDETAETCISGSMPLRGRNFDSLLGSWSIRLAWNDGRDWNNLTTMYFGVRANASSSDILLSLADVNTAQCPDVKLTALVRDPSGAALSGLTSSNFRVAVDGKPVTPTVRPVPASDQLSVLFIVDATGSLNSADLAAEIAAAKQFFQSMPASASIALYQMGDNLKLREDFTTDRAALTSALLRIDPEMGTPLYRSIAEGAQILGKRAGRRALLIMTDGGNTMDGMYEDAVAGAAANAVPVISVGFGDAKSDIMDALALDTGGFYAAADQVSQLSDILAAFAKVLSTAYEVSFSTGDGSAEHAIAITATANGRSSQPAAAKAAACTSAPPPTQTAGVVLTINSATGNPGGTVDVPITIKSTNAAPSAFQLDVAHDSLSAAFNSARRGESLDSAGKDVASLSLSSGKLRLVGAGMNQKAIADGAAAYMTFAIPSSTRAGTIPLTCSAPASVDAQSKALPTTCISGQITVAAASSCTCDITGDGKVDVADVQTVINRLLAGASSCDLNGDGKFDVGDTQTIINVVLGQACPVR